MANRCILRHRCGAGLGGPVPYHQITVRRRTCEVLRATRRRTPSASTRRLEPALDEEMSPIANLDLRAIRTQLADADGDLVLLIDDGEVQVEFDSGVNGSWEQAIQGAQRVASAALAYAAALRAQRPSAGPG